MIIDRNTRNRCIIFLYYDKDGLVDRYVTGLLDALREVATCVYVVVNGYITEEAERELAGHAHEVRVRVNTGYDVGGYREGIFRIGFDRLSEFDELVLMNYTFFAPLFPLGEMFSEMSARDVDFWGITKHHNVPVDTTGGRIRYGHIPENLNSHFLALRRDFFLSYSYMDFMINMTNPISYETSINDYEAVFTKYFADLGFKWDVYTNTDEFEGVVYAPFMFEGGELVEKRCPIVKRRLFFGDYFSLLANSAGESYSDAYRAVTDKTDYDRSMIWENLLRLQDRNAVRYALHESYIVDSEIPAGKAASGRAAVYVIGDEERADLLAGRYLRSVPEGCPVFYADGLTGAPLRNYEYVCVLSLPDISGELSQSDLSLFRADCESLIGSGFQVENTALLFDEHTELGLLVPPMPNYGTFYERAEDGWYGRYEDVRKTAEETGLTFPILRGEMPPVFARGGSFWARGEVLSEILSSEKMQALAGSICDADGGAAQADRELLMLMLPCMFQREKYMTGTVTGTHYASVALTNLEYELRENNRVLFGKVRPDAWWKVLDRLSEIGKGTERGE